jgi:type IV pilus assembly protein PilA
MRKIQQGFTLIELMIVVAIIGILAAIAIPNYQTYTMKAKFTEVVQAVDPFKIAVEGCFQEQQLLGATCGTPSLNGIPADLGASGKVLTVKTTSGGVVTATGLSTMFGGTAYQYTLTPTLSGVTGSQNLTWSKTGSCTTAAIC